MHIEFNTSNNNNNNSTSTNTVELTINGLKDTYKVGEEVDFIIKVTGYRRLCTFPNIAVQNTNTGQVVWYSRTAILSFCEPAHDINEEFHPRDIDRIPIILNETGTYRLGASVGGKPLLKNFDVVN
jgi:hypothetical protein